jgi:uncharacterized membrane protein YcfT
MSIDKLQEYYDEFRMYYNLESGLWAGTLPYFPSRENFKYMIKAIKKFPEYSEYFYGIWTRTQLACTDERVFLRDLFACSYNANLSGSYSAQQYEFKYYSMIIRITAKYFEILPKHLRKKFVNKKAAKSK